MCLQCRMLLDRVGFLYVFLINAIGIPKLLAQSIASSLTSSSTELVWILKHSLSGTPPQVQM